MAVKIRLTRKGKKKQPTYRVVVADGRSPRDGRYIEQIGRYDPRQEPSIVEIDNDRATYWLSVGAQPSDAVRKLLEISGALPARPEKISLDAKVHVVDEAAQAAAADDDGAVAAAAEATGAGAVEPPEADVDSGNDSSVPIANGASDDGEGSIETTDGAVASATDEVTGDHDTEETEEEPREG